MSRILVIGGYGGFGARLSRRLLAAGHHVVVAGRSLEKAARFCEGLPGAEPIELDRTQAIRPLLADARPALVIDAAGPFQGSSYAVPIACIEERVSYVDLADAREFVCGIGELDDAARSAGVVVISGASTLPALSSAVARHLSTDLGRVGKVEIALSASTRSTATLSIAKAILSYVGKRTRVWRGGQWTNEYGWQSLRRHCYGIASVPPLKRWVALADVPDLELLPPLLHHAPSVEFRAGTDSTLHMLFLWMASWLVRWGWVRSLAPAAKWLVPIQKLTAFGRGERSAMQVTLKGSRGGKGVERRWTLIAERFDGPEIPTMAAAILADDILAGRLAPGARNAASALSIERFERSFEPLAIVHEITERSAPSLYERVMGAHFRALPATVQAIHQVHGDGSAAGEGTVNRGRGGLARLLCRLMRFPPAGSYPVHVAFAERNGAECWTRDFGGHRFKSVLRERDGFLTERFGPVSFSFELPSGSDGLRMILRRWSVLGVRLPLFFAPRIDAREWEQDGRFCFSVSVAMPLAGRVVQYEGWLLPGAVETKRAARERRTALA